MQKNKQIEFIYTIKVYENKFYNYNDRDSIDYGPVLMVSAMGA